ncbi:hypothetical protein LQZ19_07400 [Treponema primitia]|uniref:hypothetical protein n=1 Tax=Treponema primitia TaxID=88058 RepID=UPI0039818EAD
MVSLGREAPSWELNRWGRDVLRFSPLIGGAYSLRGDRNTLHYSGKKQSHRFTILDNEHFEYDIILNAEPESNRFYVAIEGWEQFDFFRQPDTFGPEILRGSYAVYKKEGVINSAAYHVGTGKICHIHRPKIIDARGRWTWGDIFIDQGVMTLTVPEGWLGEAKYPVVVDPVIGSNTVGAYLQYDYLSNTVIDDNLEDIDEYSDWDEFIEQITGSELIGLYNYGIFNKYKTSLQLQGTYNTYMYVFIAYPSNCYLYPLIYSELNNKPKRLLNYSCTPGYPLAGLSRSTDFTARWVPSTITINDSIAAGTDIWFGHFGNSVIVRFDYGVPLYQLQSSLSLDYDYTKNYNSVRTMLENRQFLDISGFQDSYANPNSDDFNILPGARHDMKISMYLEINTNAYTRTLTQGVKLTDGRKLTAAYTKTLAMNGRNTMNLGHGASYSRQDTATVIGTDTTSWLRGIYRNISETIKILNPLYYCRELLRRAEETARAFADTARNIVNRRAVFSNGGSSDGITWGRGFFRSVAVVLKTSDMNSVVITLTRNIAEWVSAFDTAGRLGDYFRGLLIDAENIAETGHTSAYYRRQEDTAYTEGYPLRHLFIFIRLLSGSFVRDFILKRFLKSNEELSLKSVVCREIVLESRIH